MKEIRRLLVLQHLEIEGPGLFEQFAKERDLKIEIIRLDNKNALPQTKKGDLILIMGGPMGVKDIGSERYPWLKLERDFIKKELENERPIIGVCGRAFLLSKRIISIFKSLSLANCSKRPGPSIPNAAKLIGVLLPSFAFHNFS